MNTLNLSEYPHRRHNPLTGEWILVSPQRLKRPWQGQVEHLAAIQRPSYDPECYLCPGNLRASDQRNPNYAKTFVFDNDFGALLPDAPTENINPNGVLIAHSEPGICRVICFSPHHDLTLAQMPVPDIRCIVDTWCDETIRLGERENINHVQIFENKGSMMGCSNPHPHGQIWAQYSVPTEIVKESENQSAHLAKAGNCLLCDVLKVEIEQQIRIIDSNDYFVALVPYWAAWPFEVMILPRHHHSGLISLKPEERQAFAAILKAVTVRYDGLFDVSFPYTSGIHQAPTDGKDHSEWHLHVHFYPPLLRSATVRKFMVGYEMLAEAQRDLTAEQSADILRGVILPHT
ncbi:MAG: UDP-glucose--hexose-1-phosphate uridylyltransferase [Candidatus Marinimicrobia bacterium]|nr:UDP-glucose--hexose-1-phosphate uridylyltransferase [Candidatus Neomarinimicrobiota bacterium]